MPTVYQETLPESCLLLLTPAARYDHGRDLARSLRLASRSGKSAVWVDCGLMDTLPAEAVQLLWNFHHRLQARHMKLVVVHASERVRRGLLDRQHGPSLCFAPTLFDAAWHTRQHEPA